MDLDITNIKELEQRQTVGVGDADGVNEEHVKNKTRRDYYRRTRA